MRLLKRRILGITRTVYSGRTSGFPPPGYNDMALLLNSNAAKRSLRWLTSSSPLISDSEVPTREAWQTAINECGFDLQLDPEMKPMEDSAFSPCTLLGKQSGVEIYYEGDPEFLNQFSSINQGRNFCISFRWGGAMDECACASIASYALAKNFGAIVSYEGDAPSSLEDLLNQAKQAITLMNEEG